MLQVGVGGTLFGSNVRHNCKAEIMNRPGVREENIIDMMFSDQKSD